LYGERTFIIPKGMNWQEIYEAHFGQSFTIGFQPAWSVAVTKGNSQEGEKAYLNCVLDHIRGTGVSEFMPLEIAVKVQNTIRNNLITILSGEISPPLAGFSFFDIVFNCGNLCSEELFEFMFVTFGCPLYLRIPQWNERILLDICGDGKAWAMDLLVGVTSPERMRLTDEETGDSVFHVLAKEDNGVLIDELIGYGHIPIAVDNDGKRLPFCKNKKHRLYTYYFEDPEEREYFERNFLDQWKELLLKANEQGRKTMKSKTGSIQNNSTSTEKAIITNLKHDARASILRKVKKAVSKTTDRKSVTSVLERISRNNEENVKKAEQLLLKIIQKDEKYPS
jgi:hypothetical protein